jgi:hypothetical protein
MDSRPDGPDGGDVADRTPDTIQREIEQTRAELADTIDAIADRISPRRAASRGAQAVKHQVSAVLGNSNGHAPSSVLDAPPHVARHAGTPTHQYTVKRSLRTDRVLLAVGAVAAVAGAVILWRGRK